jgi:signal-transduction protein with cAMP-binding, CBS, and nucleotidyltransferase domain
MRTSELMHSPAVTCGVTTSLRDVAQLMARRNVGSVIVLDQIGYLAGIVTDRDLAVRGMGEGRSGDVAVETVMTRDVATVLPNVDVTTAGAIMTKHGVRRLPVVDDEGTPHGMVTLDDLMRQLSRDSDALADTLLGQSAGFGTGL